MAAKAASARRTSARKKPGPKPGQKFNKDGSPRKKPGPAPGTPRGKKSTGRKPAAKRTSTPRVSARKTSATPMRRGGPRGPRQSKSYSLYAIEGNELAFVCEAKGTNGPNAVLAAVQAGQAQAGVPYVPLDVDTRMPFAVEATVPEPVFTVSEVKPPKAPKPPAPQPASDPELPAATPPVADPSVPPVSEQPPAAAPPAEEQPKRSARSARASAPRPDSPEPAPGNPFAT